MKDGAHDPAGKRGKSCPICGSSIPAGKRFCPGCTRYARFAAPDFNPLSISPGSGSEQYVYPVRLDEDNWREQFTLPGYRLVVQWPNRLYCLSLNASRLGDTCVVENTRERIQKTLAESGVGVERCVEARHSETGPYAADALLMFGGNHDFWWAQEDRTLRVLGTPVDSPRLAREVGPPFAWFRKEQD